MSEMSEMNCAMLADAAAELALGVLTGRERADAIEHLDRCEACREDVRKLIATGEEFLGLLPPAEPPAGFETRVLDRLGLMAPAMPAVTAVPAAGRAATGTVTSRRDPPGRHGRRRASSRPPRRLAGVPRFRKLLAAAAIAVALAGAGIGGWASHPVGSSPQLTSATLTSGTDRDQSVGEVFVYQESPRWLYMSVDLDNRSNDTVHCQVITADGKVDEMGVFQLSSGYGWWSSPLPVMGGMPEGARLVASDGTVLASATFSG
jgi:hypothetical protein